MSPEEVKENLKKVKQSFRLMMNGPAAASMREKGLDYKLNWGVPYITLRNYAKELPHDYDFAVALWKEDIRECKILAILLMPRDRMSDDLAELWMEQTHTQEMAEFQVMGLYQYLSFAPEIAYRWMASDDVMHQISGFDILGRLFMQGKEPNSRGINEFLDQAIVALHSDVAGLRHAAMNAVSHFAELGLVYERMAKSALKREGMDWL